MFRCGLIGLVLATMLAGPLPLCLHHATEHSNWSVCCSSVETELGDAGCCQPVVECVPADCSACVEFGAEAETSADWSGQQADDCSLCYLLGQSVHSGHSTGLPWVAKVAATVTVHHHAVYCIGDVGIHSPRGPPQAV